MSKILVIIFMAVLLTGCKIGGGGGGASSGSASGVMASIQSDSGITHQSDSEAPVLPDSEAPVSSSTTVVPEPSTIVIFSLGLAALAAKALRRKKA